MTNAPDTATARTPRAGFAALQRVDLGEIEYEAAAEQMRRGVAECQSGAAGDRLFLLSHPAVVTYSPRTPADDLPPLESGLPVVLVDRGGFATTTAPDSSWDT